MRKLVSQGIFMVAGLLATPSAPSQSIVKAHVKEQDPRLSLLKQFFEERDCPVSIHAAEFIRAADENSLDWRLLPSISIVESSGGKYFRNNNIFGWDSPSGKFPSIQAAIHMVASRLGTSKLYKNKDVEGILRTYNTNADYPGKVKRLMTIIGPARIPAISYAN